MTRGGPGTEPGINLEPPYDPTEDIERTRRQKRALAIGTASVATPSYLLARGLREGGSTWGQVPRATAKLFKSPGYHTVGQVGGTMYKGLTATGRDIKTGPGRLWRGAKSIGGQIRAGFREVVPKKLSANDPLVQLNSKLDDLIQFAKPRPYDYDKRNAGFTKWATLYGAGALTGAGIATGSLATRKLLKKTGRAIHAGAGAVKDVLAKP